MKLKFIAAAAIALTALSSHAVTVNWGAHDVQEPSGFVSPATDVFSDKYTFTLTSTTTLASHVDAFGLSGSYSILTAGGATTGNSWDYSSLIGTVHTATLAAGSYYYRVFGEKTVDGSTALYGLTSSVVAAPVPEPETYALLAAGLGVIGFVSSRRRRDS